MILEKMLDIAFDSDRAISSVHFLNESSEEIGRATTKISITAGSRLFGLIEELYQEFADGYATTHQDPVVTSIKVKWEDQNPVKVDIGIKANSPFGVYSTSLKSPSTVHITERNALIRSISDAAFREFASYDKAVPAYNDPIYEQTSLFQALPDLSMNNKTLETVAA